MLPLQLLRLTMEPRCTGMRGSFVTVQLRSLSGGGVLGLMLG
jgi:hypothetical protein